MKKKFSVLVVVTLSLGAPVWAEGGDTLRGQAYSQGMCSSCHSVAADGGTSTDPKAPTFKSIKLDYDSGASLAAWMNTKHPPFGPNLLKPEQAEDILAYVAMLRATRGN